MKDKKVAVVTGVGPGLGAALARRFAEGYAVAILARKPDFLRALAAELPRRQGYGARSKLRRERSRADNPCF
jgi:NAD(P)-dependent dehydrogenase (short-subunit alcohol dehydrogenase family)